MPSLSFERHVPFGPDQMLALVADVRSYPAFVPNCSAMLVTPLPEDGLDTVLARMTIKFGPVTQSYSSKVRVDREEGIISVHAVDGPFSHLDSHWHFIAEDGGTLVRFDIDFEISNRMMAVVAERAFAAKQGEILDAFVAESYRRFGSQSASATV